MPGSITRLPPGVSVKLQAGSITTVVNGDATWEYYGTITTQVGTAAPQTMSYDPEVQIEDLDSGSK